LEFRTIDRHFSDPQYIAAMAELLKRVLEQTDAGLETHLLFVAHSIPESYIAGGDPYASEVEQTMKLICRKLGTQLPHSLAYQSRVGPVRWRGPTLGEELARLKSLGVEQIILQPLSFVSENLETLYDLDIEFRSSCEEAGVKLHRVPALSDFPPYIEALAGLIEREIESWEAADA